mmetsp:Transcript_36378/g.60283  ORF Transcript_36378/g.60283 Transcript_36378/m.60283 type:complete len:302 (+) Transcript_36378:169-1074(+)
MGKKKSKRGANLDDARKVKAQKGWEESEAGPAVELQDASHSRDADADFVPSGSEDEPMPDGIEPEPAEPGERHRFVRDAARAEGGASAIRRLDGQAAAQRRSRRRRSDLAAMPSIEDAIDGTLFARRLPQELEPDDAWAEPAVAVAEPVATDADGERVVVLGMAATACEQVKRHLCLFLPKFHCELNAIERYWGATKKWLRRHCSYSLPGLRATLPIALSQSLDDLPEADRGKQDLPVSPLLKMRRWFRISWQYAIEYRKGTACADVVQAMAKYRSKRHRDMGIRRCRQVEAAMEHAALGS